MHEQVLQQPEARSLGGRVIGGITQRLAARLLQQVLRTPATVPSSNFWQLYITFGSTNACMLQISTKFGKNNIDKNNNWY